MGGGGVLCRKGGVVHEEEIDITGCCPLALRPNFTQGSDVRTVVDEESLVAGGHEVAGLLVGAVSDLFIAIPSAKLLILQFSTLQKFRAVDVPSQNLLLCFMR